MTVLVERTPPVISLRAIFRRRENRLGVSRAPERGRIWAALTRKGRPIWGTPSQLVTGAVRDDDERIRALAPWSELIDAHRLAPASDSAAFIAAFGDGPMLLLVRPDAYVGFAGRHEHVPELVEWLARWFPAQSGE